MPDGGRWHRRQRPPKLPRGRPAAQPAPLQAHIPQAAAQGRGCAQRARDGSPRCRPDGVTEQVVVLQGVAAVGEEGRGDAGPRRGAHAMPCGSSASAGAPGGG
jgi:hypothetical protein